MDKYRFYKNEIEWYVDLPAYVEQGGTIEDLQMVEGADVMLDIVSNGNKKVDLNISSEKFEGADQLILKKMGEPLKGGAYYYMKEFEGKEVNLTMWLCKVIEFVFGEIPENIFLARANV